MIHTWLSEPGTINPSSLTDVILPPAAHEGADLGSGFSWTRAIWSFCFSQQMRELGTVLLPQARVRNLNLLLEVRCGGPTCVLLFTLPKVPDVSQGHGCVPTPFYPHRGEALAEGCKGLFHRYRATGHNLLLKFTLFAVRKPHSQISANIQQLSNSTRTTSEATLFPEGHYGAALHSHSHWFTSSD